MTVIVATGDLLVRREYDLIKPSYWGKLRRSLAGAG